MADYYCIDQRTTLYNLHLSLVGSAASAPSTSYLGRSGVFSLILSRNMLSSRVDTSAVRRTLLRVFRMSMVQPVSSIETLSATTV